jgi:hypothetical protein
MQKTQATPAASLGVLAVKWLDVIERHFLEISQDHEEMRTTRLVDTLRFWRGGHIFATLDARPEGLVFTDCTEGPHEHAGLKLVETRELIGLAVGRAVEQGLTRQPASPRPASQDRYGKVIPLSPDASAR